MDLCTIVYVVLLLVLYGFVGIYIATNFSKLFVVIVYGFILLTMYYLRKEIILEKDSRATVKNVARAPAAFIQSKMIPKASAFSDMMFGSPTTSAATSAATSAFNIGESALASTLS